MWRLPPFGGLFTLVAGEGASRLLSFVAIALLTRRLGVAAWAPVAVALTAVQFGSLFVESGMRLYGAREVARDAAAIPRLTRPIVATQLVVALTLVAVSVLVWAFGFVDPSLAALLPGYAVSLVALPFFVPWIFQGLGAMQWVAVPQVARFAAFLVLSAVVVTAPARAIWLPWIESVSMAVGAIVALLAVRKFSGAAAGPDATASHASTSHAASPAAAFNAGVVRDALPIAASQMIWVVRMYLPILLLWQLTARESVARFDVAHRLLMVLQAFLTVYLANLYTPLSRAATGARRPFIGLLLASTAFAGLGAAAGAAVLVTLPGTILSSVFGQAYGNPEAAAALVVLALLVPVLTIRGHAHYALVALGRQRRELACAIAASLVLIVLLVLWVPSGGGVGAARAMLVSEVAGLLLTWIALGLALREPAGGPVGTVSRPPAPVG